MAEKSYYCVNGPKQGQFITQSSDRSYFLFNRSSRIIRTEDNKWAFNKLPSAILLHIDSLPEVKTKWEHTQ